MIGADNEGVGGELGVGYAIRSNGKKLSTSTRWTSMPAPSDPVGDHVVLWGWGFAR